jgi:Holliday junction resolvase
MVKKQQEKTLQPKIIKYLENNGYYVVKTIKLNKSGLPDIFAFKDGNTVMIEVKSEGKKPSKIQDFRIREVQGYGVKAFYCDTYESFIKKLYI